MSHQPLSVVHPGGTRVLQAFQVPPVGRDREARPHRSSGGGVWVRGDLRERPQPFIVRAEVPAASLSAAYVLAYAIIAEAEAATAVTTHEGEWSVRALLGYSIDPLQTSVLLTLRWAAAARLNAEAYVPPPASGWEWSASSPDWSSSSPSWDASG